MCVCVFKGTLWHEPMSGFVGGDTGVKLSDLNVDLAISFRQVFVSPSVKWEL